MAGRESAAVERAVAAVQAGSSVTDAARTNDCDVRSVRRALRRRGVAPLPRVSGPEHPAAQAAERRRLERLDTLERSRRSPAGR